MRAVSRRKQKSLRKETKRQTSNEIEIIDVSDYKPRRIPPPLWREGIKKMWEVDPLECPHTVRRRWRSSVL